MKVNQKTWFLAVTTMIFFTIITNQAYAQSIEKEASWQIIYLSDKTMCQINEERKVQDIADITQKYLEIYQIDNQKHETVCLFYEEFLNNPISNNTDLYIIIFDEQIGNKLFLKHGYNGLYAHFGSDRMQNHVIMIAMPPQFNSAYENIEIPWSLSEKLSYFILSYYGHNVESIVRALDFELENEKCVKELENKECKKSNTIIHSNISGDDYKVKPAIKEIVNQKSMKYLPDDLYTSKVVKEVLRKNTGWWLEGLIDDQMYIEIIKQIVDIPIKENSEVNITQLSISNGFSIVDKTKSNTITDNNGEYIDTENEIYTSLKYVPFDTNTITMNSEFSEIPSWFKNRAIIWNEEKLGDRVFLNGLTALVQNGLIKEN